jgi:hypothetical protein
MIYLVLLLLSISLIIILLQWGKIMLWKMEQDLELWVSYGTGEDIVRAKEHRKEYQGYVSEAKNDPLMALNIPLGVIKLIRRDLHSKSLFKPIYFRLLWLKLRGYKI